MTKRVAFHLRVSTGEQTTENQRRELEAVARHRGWDIVNIYEDQGVSGAKGRDKRPQLDRMLKSAVRGRFDILAAWAVDRLGRSLQDLVATLGELRAAGRPSRLPLALARARPALTRSTIMALSNSAKTPRPTRTASGGPFRRA